MWIIFDDNQNPRLIAEEENPNRICLLVIGIEPATSLFQFGCNQRAFDFFKSSSNDVETAITFFIKASKYINTHYPKIWESYSNQTYMAKGGCVIDANEFLVDSNHGDACVIMEQEQIFVIFENGKLVRISDKPHVSLLSIRLDEIQEDKSDQSIMYFFTCLNVSKDKMDVNYLGKLNRIAGEFLFNMGINTPYKRKEK